MSTAQHRSKKSTTNNQIETHRRLQAGLPSPSEPLNEAEMVFYTGIIEARELSTWTSFDVTLATSLARMQQQHRLAMNTLAEEGLIQIDTKGMTKPHGAVSVAASLAGTIKSFTIQLGLQAVARGLASGDQGNRNQAERLARAAISEASGGLLA